MGEQPGGCLVFVSANLRAAPRGLQVSSVPPRNRYRREIKIFIDREDQKIIYMSSKNELYCEQVEVNEATLAAIIVKTSLISFLMPTFVPVVDVEKPRFERDDFDANHIKSRKFDNPHSLIRPPEKDTKNKRGFADGSVGWGVLGEFGSYEKDDGSAAHTQKTGKCKMVKNGRGLWVKANDDDDEEDEETLPRLGKGRGGGIPVFQPTMDITIGGAGRASSSDSKNSCKVDQSCDRRSPERRRRSRSRSRSRENGYAGCRGDNRNIRRMSDNDRARDKARETEREGDGWRDRDGDRHRYSRERDRGLVDKEKMHVQHKGVDNREFSDDREQACTTNTDIRTLDGSHDDNGLATVESVDEQLVHFSFNAVQVVNRFLEVFSKTSKFRLDEIEETYGESAVVCNLKNGKVLLSGKSRIRLSFSHSIPHECSATRRIFIECSNGASFAFDFHKVGQSPGLGDPNKETVLLYRVFDSVITNVWGCVDKKNMASTTSLSLNHIISSELWPMAMSIVLLDDPSFTLDQCHFHDYTDLEVWG